MRLPARPWRITLVGGLAAALVLVAGVAVALVNQQQGNVTKLYVTSAPDFITNSVQWTPVNGLLIIGTWHPGDLIVAHLDAETTCKLEPGRPPIGPSIPVPGAPDGCRIFIGLTGPDPEAPNIELEPTGASTYFMDSTNGPPGQWISQAHGLTRYIIVPDTDAVVPFVWVEASVTSPNVKFRLHMAVLTVEIVTPTVT
jgi:hypothetical protein